MNQRCTQRLLLLVYTIYMENYQVVMEYGDVLCPSLTFIVDPFMN